MAPGSPNWVEGINETGETRVDRLRSLEKAFKALEIPVRFDVVPGVEHTGHLVHPPVKEFFTEALRNRPPQ